MVTQSTLKCIIIDDNELDRMAIVSCLEDYTFIEIAGSFENPLDALGLINTGTIQLLFLDIDMPVINGLQFFRSLEQPPLCVLITSHPEYALEGYDHYVLDYILKPAKQQRLERAVNRAREFYELRQKAELYDIQFSEDFLTIKESYDLIRIKMSDIIYLEALKDYTKVVTTGKTYMTLANLKTFFEKLPPRRFLRIHRSYAVGVTYIKKIEQNELLLEQIRLPIGKTFRQQVNLTLKQANV